MLDVFADESAHGFAIGILDYAALNMISGLVFHSGDNRLANSPSHSPKRPLRHSYVTAIASHVGLIDSDGVGEGSVVPGAFPSLTDTIEHKQYRRLADSEYPHSASWRICSSGWSIQEDTDSPFAMWAIGLGNWRPHPDAAILAPVRISVGHWYLLADFPNLNGPTVSAASLFRPPSLFKPSARRLFVWEHFHDMEQGKSLSTSFPKCLVSSFLHATRV